MMTRLSLVTLVSTLAFVGGSGLVQAQTYVTPAPAPAYSQPGMQAYPSQAMTMDSGMRYQPAFTDEYGMRYNSRGDRIDAQGRIMPPPVTPPGVAAYR